MNGSPTEKTVFADTELAARSKESREFIAVFMSCNPSVQVWLAATR